MHSRVHRSLAPCAIVALLLGCGLNGGSPEPSPPEAGASAPAVTLTRVASYDRGQITDSSIGQVRKTSVLLPVDLEFFPDDSGGALLAVNTGAIVWLSPNWKIKGQFEVPSANDLAHTPTAAEFHDNEGLLGLTFDANFAQNRWFYVHLNATPLGGVEVWKLTWKPDALSEIWDTRELMLHAEKSGNEDREDHMHNHNGGNPSVGPDGQLYVLLGDGGMSFDEDGVHPSADPASPWGKVLRLDPEGLRPPRIIARGLRNPYSHSWWGDLMLIGDVGEDAPTSHEEINRLEGTHQRDPVPDFGHPFVSGPAFDLEEKRRMGWQDPIHAYRKNDSTFIAEDPQGSPPPPETLLPAAVIVGPVYTGDAYGGALQNVLIYADFLQDWVRGALVNEHGQVLGDRHLFHYSGYTISFTIGPDEKIYMLTRETSRKPGLSDSRHTAVAVYRLDPPSENEPSQTNDATPEETLPRQLSELGAFSDLPTASPAADALEYTPQFGRWINGLDVRRFMRLPRDGQIDSRDPDHWIFPIGTELYKTLSGVRLADGDGMVRPIETQLLRKTPSGWVTANYVWRPDASDADLNTGRSVFIDVRAPNASDPPLRHVVGTASQCMACHAPFTDQVIGVSALQLNDGDTESSRLTRWAQQGWLSDSPSDGWPRAQRADTIEHAARGYFHGNCSHCHGANDAGRILGFSLTYEDADSVIGHRSTRGRGTLIAPGSPERSTLLSMIRGEPGVPRMPMFGANRPDAAGVATIQRWIESVAPAAPSPAP